jgi:hypothetical protein
MSDSSRFHRRRFIGAAAATLAAGPLGVAEWLLWLQAIPDMLMESTRQVVSASKSTGLPPSFPIGSIMSASSAIKASELASINSASGWIKLAAIDGRGAARESGARPVLDLLLHQLDPHTALCPRMGTKIPEPWIGGDRRARARVRVRETSHQCPLGRRELRCGSRGSR